MAFCQKKPQNPPDLPLETHSETQDLEVEQAAQALEEVSLSSHPPMPGYSEEAPDEGISSTTQSSCSCSIVLGATPSSRSGGVSSTQEEEGNTSEAGSSSQEEEDSILEAVPDPRNVPRDAQDEKVAMLVNFMLLKYRMKKRVSKAEMLRIVGKEHQEHFAEMFLAASGRIGMVFGLDIQEVDPIQQRYEVLIKLGLTYDGMLHGESRVPKTGILILTLGTIFMKGNHATEEEIWEILSMLELYPGKEHHIFGDPSSLIRKYFVEEEYLIYQKVANSDPAQFEFLWGPRTYMETTKMQVLEFMAKMHGTDPRSFTSQYEEALKDEQNRPQTRLGPVSMFQ